ncbi:phage tail tape measure C-terminal domain-containing protein [Citrobacter portucalensis]|uniref:phage tail tape measure C-terminal domain-containing protein n=1 Tax=Citrobacter portucalensis TaxID=1639133 RepID=UPI001F259EAF|nr:phage tail tape measure C-terminal domain-containing protein [Citrobacter portucalensis]
MAGDNAELGFSVDTSQVTEASKRLDELSKSAQGAADSGEKLSNSFEESMKNMRGSISGNHQAMRELTVMMHEAMSGNWGRMRGSAMILGGAMGLGGLASGVIIGGITLVSEGVEKMVDQIKEATAAENALNQAAVMSGDFNMLDSDYISKVTDGYRVLGLSMTETENTLADFMNAGMSEGQIDKAGDKISRVIQLTKDLSDKQKQQMRGELGGLYSDPTAHIKEFYSTYGNLMSDAQQQRMQAAEQTHDAAKVEMTMQSEILELLQKQGDIMELNAKIQETAGGAFQYENFLQYGGATTDANRRAFSQHNQFLLERQQEIADSMHKSSRELRGYASDAEEEINYHAPKTHIHHGLTDAEKAAKKLIDYQTRIKDANSQFDTQITSISDSVNRAWNNKLYSYSMTSDQHDFANRIETINEQFDRMRENVDRLALQHHKSIGSKEYVEMFQKIELGRKNVLAENVAGFNEMESLQHSALAGMDEEWIKYQKQVNDVASQSEKVFDTAVEGMTNSLTDFFTTGEAGWTNFVKSIATITEKYMVQDWIVEPLAGLAKGGISSLFSSNPLSSTANTFAVPDIPKLGAAHLGGGLGPIAPVINITINDNGNKGGVDSNVSGTTGQAQKMGAALDKFLQNYIKEQNVKSNRQGGLNKTMGNWSTR